MSIDGSDLNMSGPLVTSGLRQLRHLMRAILNTRRPLRINQLIQVVPICLLLEGEAIPHKGDSCSGTTLVSKANFFY